MGKAGAANGIRPASDQLVFTTISCDEEVDQLLAIQAANAPGALTAAERQNQGFITVRHEPAALKRMNKVCPSVIAKDGGRVAGYVIMMPRDWVVHFPVLLPMLHKLYAMSRHGVSLLENKRWFIMGQVAVAAGYRGQGVFDRMYAKLRDVYRDRYDFVVTEVSARNPRSLAAHYRVGFKDLEVFFDAEANDTWHVMAWDF